jgi:hypothetical protein
MSELYLIPVFESYSQVATALLVFIFGYVVILKVKNNLNISTKMSSLLYLWHTFFCVIYMVFTFNYGGDALAYYSHALNGDTVHLEFGTAMVKYMVNILVNILNLSYFGAFLFFNILGSIGLLLFYASLRSVTLHCSKRIKLLGLVMVLLPSASFWSSAIGKDSISFLAVNLALWAALKLEKRMFLMALSVILMLLVRPHMAGMIAISLVIFMFLRFKIYSQVKKIFIILVGFPVAIALIFYAGKYTGIDDITNATEVISYIESRQGVNLDGGSSLDIKDMSLPVKVFTYLFRPLPYEAHSITSLLSAVENMVYFALFIYAIRFMRVRRKSINLNHVFLWSYVFLSTIILSSMTANLGIAVRQKWMIMPIIIYLLLTIIKEHQLKMRINKTL